MGEIIKSTKVKFIPLAYFKNKKMKKESLSIIIVKTLLAVIILVGMGTIIIGGVYIIGEYYKISNNQTNNQSWNSIYKCSEEHPEFCDRSCEIDRDCYPSCTYSMGCLRSGEGQVGASAIKCEVAPFSCKCENNKCEIVEYEYKIKLLQSAEILGILYPLEIKEVAFYEDGGTTGIIAKDANNKDFSFCLDGRMQETKIGEETEPYHIYFKTIYPTDANAQEISIAGEKEKAILNILQDWVNKQVSEEEHIRLLNIRTVVGLSEEELKNYRIIKVIKKLEDRNKIIDQSDTFNWQIYRNEEFGFEVKYPEGWYLASESDKEGLILTKKDYNEGDSGLVINLRKNLTDKDSKTVFSGLTKTTMIAGQETFGNTGLLSTQSMGANTYYFEKDEVLYLFQAVYYKKSDGEIEKILSTFKFIEN